MERIKFQIKSLLARKVFNLFFWGILLFGLLTRVYPVVGNNFHFTMDQGDDAVHIREILERGQFPLVGPETNIEGVYNGPLWYYFAALGYLLFGGHPFGPVFLLMILSLFATAYLMVVVADRVSPLAGVVVGLGLQVFWWFYDVSRYGFNPFPLVFLAILGIVFLIDVWEGRKRRLLGVAVCAGLGFHAEIAGAGAFLIFLLFVLGYFLLTGKVSLRLAIICLGVSGLFFIPHFFSEVFSGFSQGHKLARFLGSSESIFGGSRYFQVGVNILSMVSGATFPLKPRLGILIALGLAGWLVVKSFKDQRLRPSFSFRFVALAVGFTLVCWLWFGSNTGWRVWHTVAVPPILYVAVLLAVLSTPKYLREFLLVLVILGQGVFFRERYTHFLRPLGDQSILRNEIGAVDWVYQKAQGRGFFVYNYLPSVRDYSHQYLFWWHGKKTYGYLPCEYSRYPGVPDFFVPGYRYYQEPKRPCSALRFLIMEPDENRYIFEQWYRGVTEGTELLEEGVVGVVKVEKRRLF